ncbi:MULTISPECIES: sterol desaturase family protein [unclassified Sphingomonas]|uniref:sterol desaturase family protein n=1 Tax=unclassified Sphingomonas TaxID=196159 RepID=UPI00285D1FD3|nr:MULTISPECIES: sterol desaturase family protein [unclassified Sphingomonas]MDR6116746.1 sterol desaturase/sphingolipid hydroxylase (fatty acid hydroxylase superfamily) [Sphingomonas sp. SORGH_AS_0789]MDR6151814.1 sterol desaturase/sphingolipid hydroxylase (fatty acid hydroxylase superfamily) [Sphingomonas sp. SORGH_AS_0742]
MERLTIISPRTFFVTWAILLSLIMWAGWGTVGLFGGSGLVLGGLLTWTLFEYAMHRFVFHLRSNSRIGQSLGFLMHGNHHVDPNDPYRNMMPLVVSIPWVAGLTGMAVWLLGTKALIFMAGFTAGYVIYDTVHYACHQLPLRGGLMGALRRHHLRHHYAGKDGNYAITAIFWDRLFRSYLPAKGIHARSDIPS